MNTEIVTLQGLYLDYLTQNPFKGLPNNLYDSMNYILSLGGKRVRPLLALIGNQAAGGNAQDALPLAHMIEVFHNFSLVHDDIMDQASLRRGKETVHVKWDIPTAILSGDNLLVKTFEIWSKYQGPHAREVLDTYIKTAIEVCEGQQKDMDFALMYDGISAEQYLEMIQQKTAVLLGAALKVGYLSSGKPVEHAELFYQFALKTGLSFQMLDDYLDSFGEEFKTGKKQGGDILEGKNTWLKIMSMSHDPVKTAALFQLEGDNRIEKVVAYWKEIGLDKGIQNLAQTYYADSLKELEKLDALGFDTSILRALSEWLLGREH